MPFIQKQTIRLLEDENDGYVQTQSTISSPFASTLYYGNAPTKSVIDTTDYVKVEPSTKYITPPVKEVESELELYYGDAPTKPVIDATDYVKVEPSTKYITPPVKERELPVDADMVVVKPKEDVMEVYKLTPYQCKVLLENLMTLPATTKLEPLVADALKKLNSVYVPVQGASIQMAKSKYAELVTQAEKRLLAEVAIKSIVAAQPPVAVAAKPSVQTNPVVADKKKYVIIGIAVVLVLFVIFN